MDIQPFVNLIANTGIWCVTTFILAKYFIDYVNRDKGQEREDNKEEKGRLYSIIDNQGKILNELKELFIQQASSTEHNKAMLDKLTEIQILHTNRLDNIEKRQSRLEEEIKKIGDKL